MSILKKKFNSVIALLLALIFLLSASVEISYAMDVDKKVPVEYEAICDVITMYFNYCDSRFQEKVVKTEYVSGDYKTNNTNPEYDSVNIVSSTQELVDSRADGLMKYIESTDITLLSWDVFVGKPMKVSVSAQGNLTCEVYVWTNFVWFNHDFPEPTESGFGTYHLLSLSVDKQEYRVVSDLYDEQDISGVSTISNYSIDEEDTSSVALPIISGDDSSIAYLSANTPTQLISRSRVVTYANQYVGNYGASGDYQDYTKYNRKYKNYNLDGGDCVNYVSQCLYDAGLPKKSDWTYSEMEPHVPTVHTLQTTMPPIALILARRMILLVQHGDLRRILFKQLQRHTSLIIKLPRRSAISILGTLVFCVEAMVLHTTHLSVLRQVARLSK